MSPNTAPENAPDFDAEAAVGLDYAPFPRRIGALLIDWIACTFVAAMIIGPSRYFATDRAESSGWSSFVVLGVFLLEAGIGTALVGGSFGQVLTRIRVIRIRDGRPLSLLSALFRSFLICLVFPPLVFRPETGRGLHDLWTGSAAFRLGRRTPSDAVDTH